MTKTDTPKTVRKSDLPYRECAGIVVFNKQGKVFVGQRKGMPNNAATASWQLPQGGIDKGEVPQTAAIRELFEETSIKTIEILEETPDWIHYDLPDELVGKALKGKYRGQKQRWFAVLFTGDESEINVLAPGDGSEKSEFDAWRWDDLSNIPNLAVSFKRTAYEEIAAAFAHIPTMLETA